MLLILGFFITWNIGFSILESASCAIFLAYTGYFVSLIGRRVIVFELTVFLALLTWLVMPAIFYNYFDANYRLAFIWDKYMKVSSPEYFSYVLPATILMGIGIHIPLSNRKILDRPVECFRAIEQFLSNKPVIGFILIVIGFTSSIVAPYVPATLDFVFYLLSRLSIVGLLYLYFSRLPLKNLWLFLGAFGLLVQAISTAMFGELIFISFLTATLLLSTARIPTLLKWGGLVMGLGLILLIQSVKHEYRSVAWSEGADPIFFFRASAERISNPEEVIDPRSMFETAVRLNQGWLVANTMYHVPRNKPYGDGKTIMRSLLASFVPRVLWRDKPESGGRENIKRFWGMDISGYSMNIGVIGEAYANFGRSGGILFMFAYGLMLNLFLSVILGLVRLHPSILLWFPVLFLFPVGTETDLLSTINPLVKVTAFIIGLFLIFPHLLRIRLG